MHRSQHAAHGILAHLIWSFSSQYTYTRRLLEGNRKIREKTWKETIPRDYP